MKMLLILIVPLLLAAQCRGSDGCEVEDTRCDGEVVEICASDNVWEMVVDCEAVSGDSQNQYVCCVDPLDGMHSCLLADECDTGGD